jgi:FAD/FMN-containing dehydrogenase
VRSETRPDRDGAARARSGLVPLTGWGRSAPTAGRLALGEDLEALTRQAVLTRGLGRAYGDAAIPPRPGVLVAGSRFADRVLALDVEGGIVRAEAGLALTDLSALLLRHRLAVPVVPGTGFVTLGGMVAADVHGKNHHVAGSIGDHVRALRVRLADGQLVELRSPEHESLLRATLGGMGLTGHILEVELRLDRIPSPWIVEERELCGDLDHLLAALERDGASWPYTVCWADALARGRALGRGVVTRGRWARAEEAPASDPPSALHVAVPFDLPSGLLRPLSGRLFNQFYRAAAGLGPRRRIVSPNAFFHPLDVVGDWNRAYGRHGFTQYQCVVPREAGMRPVAELFETLHRRRVPCYLAVIKDFARTGSGLLSFPRPGITVALDVPLAGSETQHAVDALNRIVIEAGGRIYLAKDLLTRPEHFRELEPRLASFQAVRRELDPEQRIRSALSVRLFGDEA